MLSTVTNELIQETFTGGVEPLHILRRLSKTDTKCNHKRVNFVIFQLYDKLSKFEESKVELIFETLYTGQKF